MGVLDDISSISKKIGSVKPKRRSVLVITPLGITKSESESIPMSQFKILVALKEMGPSTSHELSAETGMGEDRVKHIAKGMMPQYVVLSRATE